MLAVGPDFVVQRISIFFLTIGPGLIWFEGPFREIPSGMVCNLTSGIFRIIDAY